MIPCFWVAIAGSCLMLGGVPVRELGALEGLLLTECLGGADPGIDVPVVDVKEALLWAGH